MGYVVGRIGAFIIQVWHTVKIIVLQLTGQKTELFELKIIEVNQPARSFFGGELWHRWIVNNYAGLRAGDIPLATNHHQRSCQHSKPARHAHTGGI